MDGLLQALKIPELKASLVSKSIFSSRDVILQIGLGVTFFHRHPPWNEHVFGSIM